MNKFAKLLLPFGLVMQVFALPSSADVQVLDKIIAVVDDDVVLESEMDQRMQTIRAQLANAPADQIPPDEILEKQVLERLIVESVQLQMAARGGVRISDEELNEAMVGIAAQNKMTLPEFQRAIEADGISYIETRDQVRREMAISQVQQGIMRNRIQVTEQEIKDFLASELGQMVTADEYRLAHILIPLPDEADAEIIRAVRSDAESIIGKLDNGADFRTLAVQKSAGQNALSGGDLGWRKAAQLPTIFSDVAQDMALGEVRGPIKSGSGYHIIKLMEKRGAKAEGQVPQTQVRHVLIQPSEIRSDSEAYELAEQLHQEVSEGRPFDEVAKLYSDDPGSALSGGNLGWNRAGTFVPVFEEHMKALDINEMSEVFRTVHGYHFLEVTGRRVEDFSERFKMGQAENYLRNQKFDEELESWVREIREDAFVEVRI